MFPLTCTVPLILVFAAVLPAEDRIVVRTAGGSRIGTPCVIHDYTGREVVYQTKAGSAMRRMPRREILEVTTHYNEPHTEAKKLLAEGKAKEAFEKLDTVLDRENRVWVRREILATQVNCALWNGDRVTAGERFLAIFDSDPNTIYFPLMPLSWSDGPPSDQLVQASRQWMALTTNAAAKLLAVSHLLTDKQHAASVLKGLKDLARNENAEIQRYGQIQLWREKLALGGRIPRRIAGAGNARSTTRRLAERRPAVHPWFGLEVPAQRCRRRRPRGCGCRWFQATTAGWPPKPPGKPASRWTAPARKPKPPRSTKKSRRVSPIRRMARSPQGNSRRSDKLPACRFSVTDTQASIRDK